MERWRINLYTIWFSQIVSLMSFGFGIPFLPFYIQEMGVTDPDQLKLYTAILNAAPAVTMAIMAPIWGMLADKYGKKLMLLRSMFCASFVLAAMGLATRPEHIILLRFAQGLFTGTITASSALVASNTPDDRLSYALGFLSSSTFIGLSIGPVLGGFFAEYAGYRPSFFIGAALMFLDFILVLLIAKEENKPVPVQNEKKQAPVPLLQIFTSVMSGMLLLILFTRIARTVFAPYIPLYVQEIQSGMEGAAGTTGVISGVTGFMTALSGLTLSRFGDRYNKKTLLIVLTAASIVLSLPLAFINNLWVFTAVYGMLFYTIGGIEPIATSVSSENTPAERRGILFGIQALVGSLGLAVSPFLGSWTSIRFSIKATFFLIPAALVCTLITAMTIKTVHKPQADVTSIQQGAGRLES